MGEMGPKNLARLPLYPGQRNQRTKTLRDMGPGLNPNSSDRRER